MGIQEFFQGRERLMPLFGFRLASSLRGVETDQPFSCNIKQGIHSQGTLIARSRLVGSLEPCVDVLDRELGFEAFQFGRVLE